MRMIFYVIVIISGVTLGFVSAFQRGSFTPPHTFYTRKSIGMSDTLAESSTPMKSLKYVSSVKEVVDLYSTFLLDMWGVMHDGINPYEGVVETVKKIKQKGKKMIILSNSSKRKDEVIRTLKKLGFDPEEDLHQIITSGDVSYRMLSNDSTLECERWKILSDIISAKSKKAFVYGSGNGDEEYITACGWTLCPIESADLIIARGTFTINDGSENIISKLNDEKAYNNALEKTLKFAAERRVPMLVTNPDKVRPDESLSPMPGALADAYEDLLGDDATDLVKRIGKPFPEVYKLALLGNTEYKSTLMVGDALETDVIGGARAKCATLWVTMDGIYAPALRKFKSEDYEEATKALLENFNQKNNNDRDFLCPTFVAPHFKW